MWPGDKVTVTISYDYELLFGAVTAFRIFPLMRTPPWWCYTTSESTEWIDHPMEDPGGTPDQQSKRRRQYDDATKTC